VVVKTKPAAGSGVHASLVGTVKDADGALQLTYNHWPLYTFVEDSASGQAHGQGISSYGGKWSTVGATGKVFVASSGSTTTQVTSSGGYGGY
jgi:predicted lipoprotein with Yx(FWY)xxD motif